MSPVLVHSWSFNPPPPPTPHLHPRPPHSVKSLPLLFSVFFLSILHPVQRTELSSYSKSRSQREKLNVFHSLPPPSLPPPTLSVCLIFLQDSLKVIYFCFLVKSCSQKEALNSHTHTHTGSDMITDTNMDTQRNTHTSPPPPLTPSPPLYLAVTI